MQNLINKIKKFYVIRQLKNYIYGELININCSDIIRDELNDITIIVYKISYRNICVKSKTTETEQEWYEGNNSNEYAQHPRVIHAGVRILCFRATCLALF